MILLKHFFSKFFFIFVNVFILFQRESISILMSTERQILLSSRDHFMSF